MSAAVITPGPEGVRYRWTWDDEYDPEGSWGRDADEETAAAVADERGMLDSGDYVALGCIAERRCSCCGSWIETDSLWGIVVPGVDDPYCRQVEAEMDTSFAGHDAHEHPVPL